MTGVGRFPGSLAVHVARCVALAACVAAAACVDGATGDTAAGDAAGDPAGRRSAITDAAPPGTTEAGRPQPNGVPRVLHLGEGDAEAGYALEASDPPTHVFDVEVVAPAGAELSVEFDTSDGARLHIFETAPGDSSCTVRGAAVACLLRFPILEARAGGVWAARVRKTSTAPAEVTVTVTFADA